MTHQEFERRAEDALEKLYRALSEAADDYDFEVDFNAGALAVEFEDPPARFVVSPNAPVKQIWVSANVKSYKLDWDEAEQEFVMPGTGQSLRSLLADAIGRHLGQEVDL
jgi:CyaY protein